MDKKQNRQIVNSKAQASASSQRRAPSKPVAKPQKTRTIPFMLLGICFIALHLYLNFSPTVKRGWGLNYIRFFEQPVILGFYAILIAVLIPQVNGFIVRLFEKLSRSKIIAVAGKYRYLLFVLISIGAVFAFHFLQVKYIFLGDMHFRPDEIEKGQVYSSEYLTSKLYIAIYNWGHPKWGFSAIELIRVASYICGGFFVFITLLTANALGKTFLQKTAVFIASVLAAPIIMNFCGYIELYAPSIVMLQLFFLGCILHLQGKMNVFIPLIVLIAAIGSFVLLACLLPAWCFLFYRRYLWQYPFFRKRNWLVAMSVMLIAGVCVLWPYVNKNLSNGITSVFVPFVSDSYVTMFSAAHWTEFFNSQLMSAGFMLLLWAAVIIYYAVRKFKLPALPWFFIIASFSATAIIFVANWARGSGDWDLYVLSSFAINLTVIILLLNLLKPQQLPTKYGSQSASDGLRRNIKYGVCVMLVFGVMHTGFWLITNRTDKSIQWLEHAFEKDPAMFYKKLYSNESMLAAIFSANSLDDDLILKWEKKAYQRHPNDRRTGYNYANRLLQTKKTDEATKIYEALVAKFPAYALPYAQLVNIYLKDKKYEALYKLLTQMEAAYKQNPQAFTSRLSKEQLDSFWDILKQLRRQP